MQCGPTFTLCTTNPHQSSFTHPPSPSFLSPSFLSPSFLSLTIFKLKHVRAHTHTQQQDQDPTNLYMSNLPKNYDEKVSHPTQYTWHSPMSKHLWYVCISFISRTCGFSNQVWVTEFPNPQQLQWLATWIGLFGAMLWVNHYDIISSKFLPRRALWVLLWVWYGSPPSLKLTTRTAHSHS